MKKESAPVGLRTFARNAVTRVVSKAQETGGLSRLTCRPVYRICRSINHDKRRAQRGHTSNSYKPIGRHPLNQIAHRQITDHPSYGRWKEIYGRLSRRIFPHILEVETHKCSHCIKAAPSEEDGNADGSEGAIFPKRIWNDRWSTQLFLTADPVDEGRNQRDCQ